MNSRSKNRDGIMKNDNNLNKITVKSTVPKESRKRTVDIVNEDSSSVCFSVIENGNSCEFRIYFELLFIPSWC